MITMFLATVIGWYLVILGLFTFFQYGQLKSIAADVMGNRGLFFIAAIVTLILGLLMVVSHNLWVMDWPIVITLISWLVLVSGLLRLFYLDTAMKMARGFVEHPVKMKITSFALFLIGIFLLLKVYYPVI